MDKYYRVEYWKTESGGYWAFFGFYQSLNDAKTAVSNLGQVRIPRVIEVQESGRGHFETVVPPRRLFKSA